MPTVTLLDEAKNAMRLTRDAYNDEISRLIEAACLDLGVAGITAASTTTDNLIKQAIITFCRVNFGSPADYDRLKASYDEQKAQMQSATGYGL